MVVALDILCARITARSPEEQETAFPNVFGKRNVSVFLHFNGNRSSGQCGVHVCLCFSGCGPGKSCEGPALKNGLVLI